MKIKAEKLKNFCIGAMYKSGMSKEDAQTTAEVLVTTDLMGTYTHGSKQLYLLLKNIRKGGLDAKGKPEIVSDGSSWAIVDGHFAMPMVTSTMAMNLAMEKASQNGIAYVGVRGSSHFGAAGYYANMAAQKDMIGLSMSNVDPCMAIPGGKTPLLGTNPIAYAAPTGKHDTVFLDIATSVAAVSKVYAAKATGKEIPDGWLVDEEGLPTNNASLYPEKACILPMAGHKGYGIAMLIEMLSAVMTGALFTLDVACWLRDFSKPVNEGHAFIAIDIGQMTDISEFKLHMDKLADQVHSVPKAKGVDRTYLPGEMEWQNYHRQIKDSITMPDHAQQALESLASDLEIDLTEFIEE